MSKIMAVKSRGSVVDEIAVNFAVNLYLWVAWTLRLEP